MAQLTALNVRSQGIGMGSTAARNRSGLPTATRVEVTGKGASVQNYRLQQRGIERLMAVSSCPRKLSRSGSGTRPLR
jgi:hypothetical protein